MAMLVVVGGLVLGWFVLSRLLEFLAVSVAWLVGIAVLVGIIAFAWAIGGPVAGVVAGLGLLAFLRRQWTRPYVPPTGRYGYGPGDIMPPSPKRPDGTPY